MIELVEKISVRLELLNNDTGFAEGNKARERVGEKASEGLRVLRGRGLG